ncbi:MAG: lysyl oxidase family protein [Polyangiales bacterium]
MRFLPCSLLFVSALGAVACGTEAPLNPPATDAAADARADAALDASPDVAPDVAPDAAPAEPMPNLVPLVISGREPWLSEIPADIRTGYGFRAPRIENRTFSAGSCEVQEGCTLPGGRRLLRFTLATPNRGNADLYLGPPNMGDRPLAQFEYSPCHRHYHLRGYADYRLLDMSGREVARGHKQSFCIEDTNQDPNAPIDPATGERVNATLDRSEAYVCTNQGLHAGWLDAYGQHLECQYIDITGVPAGRYRIHASINADRVLRESSYDDNVNELEIDIPEATGNPPPATPLDACNASQSGLARECGFSTEPDPRTCTPGEMVTVGCNPMCPGGGDARCEGDPILRVCPSARPCPSGASGCTPMLPYCTAAEALGANDNSCGNDCSSVTFRCPASGYYRVLTASNRAGEAYTCRLPFATP